MSTVAEIKSAIEKLGTVEFAELSSWLDRHSLKRSEIIKERQLAGIRKTAGCLSVADADEFARAVEEAGREVPDRNHDW